ncbi:hypothetical protein DRW41_07310 [Neobacillus piezotolerans]|uniref:Uncharacterized protein n=1 Tax=Neobacillus piezotolerans TaxID=2259171 RepID=A0A3D8GT51_9BACI|nr:hypothetical protein [Neobacillus piezotolerans]RDU37643.1 hypothetical protein DRW41_07310 [Neobacillus piezotolerans]
MNLLTIGKVTVPAGLAAALAAVFLAPLLYRALMKTKAGDWYWNTFFFFFLAAKLSYILFYWGIFSKSPVSLLYFHGGSKGMLLALLAVFFYLFYLAKSGKLPLAGEGLPLFHLFALPHFLILSMMANELPAAAVYFLLLAGTLLVVFQKRQLSVEAFIMLYFAEVLGVSIFSSIFSPGNLAVLAGGLFFGLMAYLKKGVQA